MVSLAIIYIFIWHGGGTSSSVVNRRLFFHISLSSTGRVDPGSRWERGLVALANTKTGSWGAGRSCSEPEEPWHGRAEHKGGTEHVVLEKGKLG